VPGNVTLLLGVGDGTFLTGVAYPVGINPSYVISADFNGDQIPDLAVANQGSNTLSLLLGVGDGTFQATRNFAVSSAPVGLALADFNGDGISDLVVANMNSNNVTVLLGTGDGSFLAGADYGVGATPVSVVAGDFNGDGRPDLAVANQNVNAVTVLVNTTSQGAAVLLPSSFETAGPFGVGSSPRSVASGDFNLDGKPDLATANFSSNDVSVLINTTPSVSLFSTRRR
jgi:hypothetical protein